MQLVSDLALAMLAIAISGDCNGAFAAMSGVVASQYVYRWWRRGASPGDASAAAQSTARSALSSSRAVALRAAIARLPAEQQRIVQLRFIEGCDVHEISVRTGLSCDEIKATQYHALAALAGALSEEKQ